MGTVSGVNTRRYHGLLIASLNPPADRYSIFPRVEETVECDRQTLALAAVQYPGLVSPNGYEHLEDFSFRPDPTWTYRQADFRFTKSVQLLEGEQGVVVIYRSNLPCRLKVRLFVSFRDYHSLMKQNSSLNAAVEDEPGRLQLQPYSGLPALTFLHDAKRFEADGRWFFNHEYLREMERGLDFREDLYSPGVLHFDMEADQICKLTATLASHAPETSRTTCPAGELGYALDQFRVKRADGQPTLMAGYPWFTDWSRDTLISLPAFIRSGFPAEETKSILGLLLAERKQGILPNRFSDQQSTPEYNTVDASLWFFVAAHDYVEATRDLLFVEQTLLPAALDIIEWHRKGTFYGIHVDADDHLLAAGEAGVQLTWMDAKIGNYVVTPRTGKPVEINALWFNALRITAGWARILDKQEVADGLDKEASEVATSFEKFWNAESGCLYDVLTSAGPDASLRPNQLFALSLPYPLIDAERAKSIVQVVKERLLTPFGLRTLEQRDLQYRPHFSGDMVSRDLAYHQGTVWPWLMGPFVAAYLYAFDNGLEAQAECTKMMEPMRSMTGHDCLGSLAEVYDGDPPHLPGGCPAQLWSVAQTALALNRLALTS